MHALMFSFIQQQIAPNPNEGLSAQTKKNTSESNEFQGLLQENLMEQNIFSGEADLHRTEENIDILQELSENLRQGLAKNDFEEILNLLNELAEVLNYPLQELDSVKDFSQDLVKEAFDDLLIEEKMSYLEPIMAEIVPLLMQVPQKNLEALLIGFNQTNGNPSASTFLESIIPKIDFSQQVESGSIVRQQVELITKVEQLLMRVNESPELVRELAPEIMKLLEQWQQLSAKLELTHDSSGMLEIRNQALRTVWQDLVQRYQQKMNFQTKNIYSIESKITTTDVIRWLSNALQADYQVEKQVRQTVIPTANLPLSQVEQFVIHLPKTGEQDVQSNLMEQFKRLVEANRHLFMQQRGQLAITLRPANLGEMVVRFTQVNGEMLVKIMVTTNVAKEMLEGNMQQLRHMFAPHQVVVERNDVLTSESRAHDWNDGGHEEQEQSEQSPSDQEQSEENGSFQELFSELMLNEKV